MRRVVHMVLLASSGLATLLAFSLLGAYYASQHTPAFYEQAVATPTAQQELAGDELEQEMLQLHNDSRRRGPWRAEFTEAQINGWLAADLPEKFPDLLPQGASAPRVAISDNRLLIACRYRHGELTTVLSLELETYLTDQPNVVAVCLRAARAGLLPLPQKRLLREIETAALAAEASLRWAQNEGDPVALIRLTLEDHAPLKSMQIEHLELAENRLIVAGTTELAESAGRRSHTANQPPAHQTRQR